MTENDIALIKKAESLQTIYWFDALQFAEQAETEEARRKLEQICRQRCPLYELYEDLDD